MVSVGIKDLKARLSSYIDRVSKGDQVIITEHGREVAVITRISPERKAIRSLVDSGKSHWSGGKPRVLEGITLKGQPLSETILEERG
ncbi:MAG: prevent-host-death protein [Nitrospira bacterium SM23_35]|jgi:prevent-host-death family protein|nr:MAG: prevent-host-death protein [Nitrospira bacterium SM23_35]